VLLTGVGSLHAEHVVERGLALDGYDQPVNEAGDRRRRRGRHDEEPEDGQ
jgi:hypothetical protein